MGSIGEHNLARLAERSFERKGDYAALLYEGTWHRSGALFDRARHLAGGLIERGIGPGDRVVVAMANCPEVGIVYNALWRAGAVVTPATFVLSARELAHVISDADASAVITTPEFISKVRDALAAADSPAFVISTGPGEAGVVSLGELEALAAAAIVPRADDDLAALLYTGGTTGRSKGVMLTHDNLYFTGGAAQAAAYVPGVNRALTTLPLSHSFGILVTLAAMHSPEPGISVLLPWFDPEAFLALVFEHRLQVSAAVPSMLHILLGQPLEDHDLSSLVQVTSGGAPLAPEVEAEFCRRVPSVTIRQGYGLTETAALIASNPIDRVKSGSVGLPVPGCTVQIVDDEGRELPIGEPGEVCCASPGVMAGYWRSPEATSEALRDGRLHTGDIGYLDDDGYLYIVDRKKDLIIRGGFNVYPRDVEDALLEHPDISLAAVVGRPDPARGEEVVAFVSLHAGAQTGPADLIEWARRRIGGYKYPREVQIVDAVPLTPVGKVDRKALRGRL